jgi:hypothetical protein
VTTDPGRGAGGRGSVAREAGGALTTRSGNAGGAAGRGPAGGGGLTTAGAGAATVAPGVTTVAAGVAIVAPGVATVAPGVATGKAASQAGQNATTTATAARLTPPPTIHGHRTRGSESVAAARGKYAAPRAGPPRCCSARLSASRM